MLDFLVNDMTCGHCSNAVIRAVKAVDRRAYAEVDLDRKRVRVEPATAGVREVMEAIAQAGYTPKLSSVSTPLG